MYLGKISNELMVQQRFLKVYEINKDFKDEED